VNVAADAAPAGPPWVIIAGFVVTVLVAIVAARAPVWLEKAKARFGKPKESPAQLAATGEAVLRAWLKETQRQRDKALKEVNRLQERIDVLEAELYRRGWNGGVL
jgi:hypothetical protein